MRDSWWLSRLAVATLLLMAAPLAARAQWPSRPDRALQVSPPGYQVGVVDACADGTGGVYVAWQAWDPFGSRLQHLDERGTGAFPAGPFVFGGALGAPIQIVSDRAGGVFVLAQSAASAGPDAVLQLHRISPAGQVRWSRPFWQGTQPNLAAWCTIAADVADSAATVAWLDGSSTALVLRAQRVDAAGNLMWGPTGSVVASSPTNLEIGIPRLPLEACVAADGDGGAWVTFTAGASPRTLRAQRLGTAGAPQWPDSGLEVREGTDELVCWSVTADGTGGIYLSWYDRDGARDTSDRVQRIRSDGSFAFGAAGLVLPGTPGQQRGVPVLGALVDGRVTVAWQAREPDNGGWCTRVQQLDSTGTWAWPGTGTLAGLSSFEWLGARVFANGDGGATITVPALPGVVPQGEELILGAAQRVSSTGVASWSVPAPLWILPTISQRVFSLESDAWRPVPIGDGGVAFFATFADSGLGGDPFAYAVHAQRLDANGRFGLTTPRIVSLSDTPDDAGGSLDLCWTASSLEGDSLMPTVAYDVLREDAGGTEVMTLTVDASGDSTYFAHAPTLADSTSPGSPRSIFRVRARDAAGRVWVSPPAMAHSFANSPALGVGDRTATLGLSPPAPNPARDRAHLSFSLPAAGTVRLALYDAAGRRVRTLASGTREAGAYSLTVPLAREDGSALAAGLYFVRLEAAGARIVRRIAILP